MVVLAELQTKILFPYFIEDRNAHEDELIVPGLYQFATPQLYSQKTLFQVGDVQMKKLTYEVCYLENNETEDDETEYDGTDYDEIEDDEAVYDEIEDDEAVYDEIEDDEAVYDETEDDETVYDETEDDEAENTLEIRDDFVVLVSIIQPYYSCKEFWTQEDDTELKSIIIVEEGVDAVDWHFFYGYDLTEDFGKPNSFNNLLWNTLVNL